MKLRRPTERLAGCVWLPRFVNKARHHLAGTLSADYVRPFCHPLATDGVFFQHFEIEQPEILQAVVDSKGSDEIIATWFKQRAQYTPESVAAWNELAPNIGKEGFPMRRGFLWALNHYYGGGTPDPRIDSAFTAIAYDEGFLDEVQQKAFEAGI